MAERTNRSKGGRKRSADPGGGIQSVGKALSILELFDEDHPAMSMTEIATRTGLNRATAYRFCQTLLGLGYLEEAGSGTLRPGLKAVSLARAALSSRELPELALPYLRELQTNTGETVNMALLDGDEVVYVERLLSDSLLALRLFVGSRLPALGSSLGRAMLAFRPEEEVDRMIDGSQLQPSTERSIVEPTRLRTELRRIRSRGYALNDQEVVMGITGVAAPIFGVSGEPIAAINLSISHPVRGGQIDAELAPAVLATARSISALAGRLGLDSA
jgi:IclR family transcriptional regulator, pca regulon regulatory protein